MVQRAHAPCCRLPRNRLIGCTHAYPDPQNGQRLLDVATSTWTSRLTLGCRSQGTLRSDEVAAVSGLGCRVAWQCAQQPEHDASLIYLLYKYTCHRREWVSFNREKHHADHHRMTPFKTTRDSIRWRRCRQRRESGSHETFSTARESPYSVHHVSS